MPSANTRPPITAISLVDFFRHNATTKEDENKEIAQLPPPIHPKQTKHKFFINNINNIFLMFAQKIEKSLFYVCENKWKFNTMIQKYNPIFPFHQKNSQPLSQKRALQIKHSTITDKKLLKY